MMNYLTATDKDVGLVINFDPEHLEKKEVKDSFEIIMLIM